VVAVDALVEAKPACVVAVEALVAAATWDARAAVAEAAAAADVPTQNDAELAGMLPVFAFWSDVYSMPSVPTTFAFRA
jgi:hypothetical protein